jgi:N-acetylmuramoyl-L-alanine amidase
MELRRICKFLYIVVFLLAESFQAPTPAKGELVTVKATKGDNAKTLLHRYLLDGYDCNLAEFHHLNGTKQSKPIVAGRSYKLPLYQYAYNGKSIRSTIGINDWDLATAIQRYNYDLAHRKAVAKRYEQSKALLVPHHLLKSCRENPAAAKEELVEAANLANAKSGKRTYPIFGKTYESVPLVSTKLKGQVFYISSGHGGPDSGAVARNGKQLLCEDEYAYDVSLRLARLLLENGATPYLITRDPNDGLRDGQFLKCDTDELCWGNQPILKGQKERLQQRCDAINAIYEQHRKSGAKKQKLIAIHVDSRAKSASADVFFYYKSGMAAGKKLAENLQETFKGKYQKYQGRAYHGTVTARDLHVLRESKPVGVYVELGNIRNPNDQKRLLLSKNRQYLAKWLFEGLTK